APWTKITAAWFDGAAVGRYSRAGTRAPSRTGIITISGLSQLKLRHAGVVLSVTWRSSPPGRLAWKYSSGGWFADECSTASVFPSGDTTASWRPSAEVSWVFRPLATSSA